MEGKHPTPTLAVDAIIELVTLPDNPIVLIKRKNPPPGWALPGGMVEVGESCEDACKREVYEETNLNVNLKRLLGVYSEPNRDPRGHVVSVVYVAEGYEADDMKAKDDATEIMYVNPWGSDFNDINLAFDHKGIIGDYFWRFRECRI